MQNAEMAELLRIDLYERYAFGDRPNQDPYLDGQNGFGQFCILCARLDLPLIRYMHVGGSMTPIKGTITDQKNVQLDLRTRAKLSEPVFACVRISDPPIG